MATPNREKPKEEEEEEVSIKVCGKINEPGLKVTLNLQLLSKCLRDSFCVNLKINTYNNLFCLA